MVNETEKAVWYAMRATYRRELFAKNFLDKKSIENFIPMRYTISIRHGRKRRELVPVVRNLVFVRATPTDIQQVKTEIPYLQYMTETKNGKKSPIIIPNEQMRRFIAVAGTYNEQLRYFKPEEINLEKGTKVRVLGGEFEGQEGVFVKVKGARDKRVVITIQGVIAVATATIHPDLIQVLL